jgi:hypothetical protein
VREFLSYHRKVDAQLGAEAEQGDGEQSGFTERLEGMVRRLERAVE